MNIAIVEAVFFEFPRIKQALLIPYGILLVLLVIVSAVQVLPGLVTLTIEDLQSRRLSSEGPLCLAVIALLASGVYAPFSAVLVGSGLHYAEMVVLVFLLIAVVDCINMKSAVLLRNEAIFSVPDLVRSATRINIDDPQSRSVIPAAEIRTKDRIAVEKGDLVPADSLVIAGSADLFERRLTFDGSRKFKKAGDTVYAGSEVIRGNLTLQALAPSSQSDLTACLDQMNAAVSSQNSRSEKLIKAETFINIFCIASAIGGALFRLGAGSSFLAVSGVLVAALLVSLFSRAAPVLWETICALTSAAARRGIFCSSMSASFPRLASIRNLVVDFHPEEPLGQYSLCGLSLLDERVSEKALYSVVLSLFSMSDDLFHKDLAASVERRCPDCRIEEVTGWAEIEDSGVAGTVQGAKFFAGTEGALLACGVRFEVDCNSPGLEEEMAFFVACGAIPIARFAIRKPFCSDGPKLVEDLEKIHVRTILAGNAPQDELDSSGRKVGLELHAISGGLDSASFRERLENAKPAALVTTPETDREAAGAADATISFFDFRAWNFNASDVVLFGRSLEPISIAVRLARMWQETVRIITFGSMAVGAVAFAFAIGRLLHPSGVAFVAVLWSAFEYALLFRLFGLHPEHRPR